MFEAGEKMSLSELLALPKADAWRYALDRKDPRPLSQKFTERSGVEPYEV
jgi:hypothetical protein